MTVPIPDMNDNSTTTTAAGKAGLRDVVIFAVDYSGSTSREREYWPRVGYHFETYLAKYGAANIIAIRWDDQLRLGTHADLKSNIASMRGNGGTSPQVVARYLINKHGVEFNVAKLCIVTDGQIGSWGVQECDKILAAAPHRIPDIEACLFGAYKPDLSVVAPFARAAKFTIRQNDEILAEGDASVAVESSGVLDTITTPNEFFAQFDELNKVIVVQNLGKTNPALRDQLLELQKRLMEWIAWDNRRKATEAMAAAAAAAAAATTSTATDDPEDGAELVENPIMKELAKGDYAAAVAATQTLVNSVLNPATTGGDDDDDNEDVGQKVARLIAKLVDACTLASFRVDALSSRRGQRATLAAAPADGVVPADIDVDAEDDTAIPTKFECPIMLDDTAAPVLLITARNSDGSSASVLDGAEQGVIDDVTNCPLNLLKYPDLVKRMAGRFDHVVGLDAFRGMYDSDIDNDNDGLISPYTRSPLIGCIPLGKHHQHAHLGSFIVRQFTTRGTSLGNAHLWVAAVYLAILYNVPRLADNAPFMAAFRAHLAYRLTRFETNLALSGLPGYPMIKAPVGVGLWYCLGGSTAMFANNPGMQGQERLRQMWGVAQYLHDLVGGVLGWPVGNEWETRAKVMRVFAYLMSRKGDLDALKMDVRRLYQASVVVPPVPIEWAAARPSGLGVITVPNEEARTKAVAVMVDGPADEAMVKSSPVAWLLDVLPLNVIAKLTSLVTPAKKFGDVTLLPSVLSSAPAPTAKTNYGYEYDPVTGAVVGESANNDDDYTPVCPATLRPFVSDPRDHAFWADRAAVKYKCAVTEQLSAYNLFVEYVDVKDAYPSTLADLAEYYASRERGRMDRPRDTLPSDIISTLSRVVRAYVRAFELRTTSVGGTSMPTAKEFKDVVIRSRDKDERKRMEEAWVESVGGVDKVSRMWA